MLKIKGWRVTRKSTEGKEQGVGLYTMFKDFRKSLFDTLFAVAIANKITPSQLAKITVNEKRVREYAVKFNDGLKKEIEKEQKKKAKKLEKELNNVE